MSTSEIVAKQASLWFLIPAIFSFIVYVICMFGETNRLPFDLPEAEGELVGGYTTEYSSMKFAWFFLAEYINMLNVSAVATTLFFGGWRAPWPLSWIGDGVLNTGWWPLLWFVAKVWLFMFLFVWIRGTLLRFRYDQFMTFGWKVLIPSALVWLVCVAVVQGVRQFAGADVWAMLPWLGGAILVVVALSFLIPEKKPAPEPPTSDEPFDAFAGGFPVPPLPGQTLPPSPRARLRAAADGTAPASPALVGGPASDGQGTDGDAPESPTQEVPRG